MLALLHKRAAEDICGMAVMLYIYITNAHIYALQHGHLCGVVFVSRWTHKGACRTSLCCAALMRSVIYECLAAASEGIISQSQSVMCTKRRQGERIHLPFSASLPFSPHIHSTFHLRPPSPLLQDFFQCVWPIMTLMITCRALITLLEWKTFWPHSYCPCVATQCSFEFCYHQTHFLLNN